MFNTAVRPNFYGSLSVVTIAHFAALAALLLVSFFIGLFDNKRDLFKPPVEIQFVPPPSMVKPVVSDTPPQPRNNDVIAPVPAPVKNKEKVKEKLKDQPPKARTNSLPRFPNVPTPRQPPMSEEMIRKMLLAGGTPSDVNVIPDDDTLEVSIVKKRFYDAWNQPAKSDAGNSIAEVVVMLGPEGSVLTRSFKRKTGIEAMDDSVTQAINAVDRIDGLSSKFLENRDNREILIKFRVE